MLLLLCQLDRPGKCPAHDASMRIPFSKAAPIPPWLQMGAEELRLHAGTKAGLIYLPDFLDLGASFANQRAALTSWHDQPQRHWRFTGSSAVAH